MDKKQEKPKRAIAGTDWWSGRQTIDAKKLLETTEARRQIRGAREIVSKNREGRKIVPE